ncbi:uncharacterized protein LOC110047907 isoform X1 [Orbicella faveolata]|uniref:uncharacterized protein LOC110047907 isoform X1 n=1 Tax=Orbicella faveolata TaxID=48498 RepID=UPI0009E63650|nr:uncharacterized protein LOC110047907 isoform X1 [Orbicella faveolata]
MAQSWRHQYQVEDEEVALAKALELSRLEEEKRQPARPIQHDPFLTRQPGHGDLVAVKITETAKQDYRMQKVQTFQEDKSLPKQTRKPQRVEHDVMGQTTRSSRLK